MKWEQRHSFQATAEKTTCLRQTRNGLAEVWVIVMHAHYGVIGSKQELLREYRDRDMWPSYLL